jgi:deoxyribose-phosphate aldolase
MHNPIADQTTSRSADQFVAQLPQVTEPRNPGMELYLDWVARVQANTSAIERRCASLPERRSF